MLPAQNYFSQSRGDPGRKTNHNMVHTAKLAQAEHNKQTFISGDETGSAISKRS